MSETTRLRSYGRRKARPLSGRKDRLLDELLPTLRLPLAEPAASRSTRAFSVNPSQRFGSKSASAPASILLWQAEHHPDVGFIGCEPFINGVASLLGKIEGAGLSDHPHP